MKRVIAFDLDGTLVDSAADLTRALNAALADHGHPTHPIENVRGFIGDGARKLVERALAPRRQGVDDVLTSFKAHYAKGLVIDTAPFEGIPAALSTLKTHARLAIATNKPGVFARPLVEMLLPGVFELVLGPDDVGAHKPDGAFLAAVAARLEGEVAAYVGDSPVDAETARNAGVPFVGVSWGLRSGELTGTAQTPAQLVEMLKGVL